MPRNQKDTIAESLRQDIVNGRFGEQLPGIRQLAERYGVHFSTINRAVDILSEEGYIERRHGSGSYIPAERRLRNIGILFCRYRDEPVPAFYLDVICRLAEALLKQNKNLQITSVAGSFDPEADRRAVQEAVDTLRADLVIGIRVPQSIDLAEMSRKPVIHISSQLWPWPSYYLTAEWGWVLQRIISRLKQAQRFEVIVVEPQLGVTGDVQQRYLQIIRHIFARHSDMQLQLIEPAQVGELQVTNPANAGLICYLGALDADELELILEKPSLAELSVHLIGSPVSAPLAARADSIWNVESTDIVKGLLTIMERLVQSAAGPHTYILENRCLGGRQP